MHCCLSKCAFPQVCFLTLSVMFRVAESCTESTFNVTHLQNVQASQYNFAEMLPKTHFPIGLSWLNVSVRVPSKKINPNFGMT